MAQDLLTKNPCMFCKPPKNYKKKINSLNREDHSRMLELARKAQPEPLSIAVELALTTGMRRGEICGLRWNDLRGRFWCIIRIEAMTVRVTERDADPGKTKIREVYK